MVFKNGNIPWNKGLLKETDRRVRKYAAKIRKVMNTSKMKQQLRNLHLGKTHTDELKKRFSESRIGKGNPMFGRNQSERQKEAQRQYMLDGGAIKGMLGNRRGQVYQKF